MGDLCWLVFGMEEKTELEEDETPPDSVPSQAIADFPSGLQAEVLELPEDFLQSLITWHVGFADEGTTPPHEMLQCPVCHVVMLKPLQTRCQHFACAKCFQQRHAKGNMQCPQDGCGADDV